MKSWRRRDAAGDRSERDRDLGDVTGPQETPVDRIADAPDRRPVRLEGTLRTMTVRPRGGVPALEAELADGSGAITVVWLGRRHITGIHAGTAVRVQGRVGRHDGARVMYNPRYELL